MLQAEGEPRKQALGHPAWQWPEALRFTKPGGVQKGQLPKTLVSQIVLNFGRHQKLFGFDPEMGFSAGVSSIKHRPPRLYRYIKIKGTCWRCSL